MYSKYILNTKLYKPVVKDHYVFRKEIINALEKNKNNQVTLVLAPTGYGKSVTVSEWLDYTKIKHCWISLDEELNDLHIFLIYLVNGVKSVFKDSLTELSNLLTAAELPNENVLSKYLINELDELDEELILVLDDYHLVKNQQIHTLINEIIKHPPRDFQLVIISRRDPPLDFSSIKSFERVNEIRMSELGFSKSEILSLAKKLEKSQIDDSIADILLNRTEGWIVGLRLALLAFDEHKDVVKTLEEIKGDRHYFTQYILKEVFLKQDEDIKKLLLAASILDRINKDLLIEIVTDTSGEKDKLNISALDDLFDRFHNSTLFIIPLDHEGTWYRYHHFFREFLLKQLEKYYSTNQIINFHKRASSYFEKHHRFEEAIHHSIKANDVLKAISIIVIQKDELLDKEHFNRIWRWLGMLPEGIVDKNPELLLIRAVHTLIGSGFTSMQKDVNAAKIMLEQENRDTNQFSSLWGEYYALQSDLSYISGDNTSAIEQSGKALSKLSTKQAYHRYIASVYRAFSLYASGRSKEAFSFITKTLKELTEANAYNYYRFLNIQSMLYTFQGDLSNLKSSVLQYQSISFKEKIWTSYVLSYFFLGEVYYQRNKPDKAISSVEFVERYIYVGRPLYISACMFRKAFCLQLMNKKDELGLYLKQINDYAANIEHQAITGIVNAFRVELALRYNDYDKAVEFNDLANYEVYPPLFNFWFPQLTFIKFLMLSDDQAKFKEAEKKLNQLIAFGRSTYRFNLLIQALPLQSLLLQKKGDEIKSLETLNEALTLSRPEGYIRNFLDLSEQMNDLLASVYMNNPEDKYLSVLLAEFKKENEHFENSKTKEESISIIKSTNETILLSDRDIELLTLLSKGYRNNEIADKLNLSTASIKKYLVTLYQKLEVQNRTGAVARATELSLFSK